MFVNIATSVFRERWDTPTVIEMLSMGTLNSVNYAHLHRYIKLIVLVPTPRLHTISQRILT